MPRERPSEVQCPNCASIVFIGHIPPVKQMLDYETGQNVMVEHSAQPCPNCKHIIEFTWRNVLTA